MTQLKLSYDRKVSPKSIKQKAGWRPEIPNAFGLPAQISCPGSTKVCESICYAFKSEKRYTNVHKLVQHNYDLLKDKSMDEMTKLLSSMIDEYRKQHERVERLRKEKYPKVFRIHWDGDFFSINYAFAWQQTIIRNKDIQFWAYTRSFQQPIDVVPFLIGLENLSLYLSVDEENKEAAKKYAKSTNVKLAVLDKTFDGAKETTIELIDRPAPKCPEQTGKYNLVTDNGIGACVECMLCVGSKNNVLFSISRK